MHRAPGPGPGCTAGPGVRGRRGAGTGCRAAEPGQGGAARGGPRGTSPLSCPSGPSLDHQGHGPPRLQLCAQAPPLTGGHAASSQVGLVHSRPSGLDRLPWPLRARAWASFSRDPACSAAPDPRLCRPLSPGLCLLPGVLLPQLSSGQPVSSLGAWPGLPCVPQASQPSPPLLSGLVSHVCWARAPGPAPPRQPLSSWLTSSPGGREGASVTAHGGSLPPQATLTPPVSSHAFPTGPQTRHPRLPQVAWLGHLHSVPDPSSGSRGCWLEHPGLSCAF